MCEDTAGSFHCVAMCPETSCCAENKCDCVPSQSPPHPHPPPPSDCFLPAAQRTAVILSKCSTFFFFGTLHISVGSVYPYVRAQFPQQPLRAARVYLHPHGCMAVHPMPVCLTGCLSCASASVCLGLANYAFPSSVQN